MKKDFIIRRFKKSNSTFDFLSGINWTTDSSQATKLNSWDARMILKILPVEGYLYSSFLYRHNSMIYAIDRLNII